MMHELIKIVMTILTLVWKMRKAQKAFYREGRKQSDLIEAKRLEKLVDESLERYFVFEYGEPVGLELKTASDEPTQERLL